VVVGMSRRNIASASPYEPVIGFSRAVRIGNVIAIGGTAPLGSDGKTVPGDAAAQARRCIDIAAEVLAEAGASLSDVIRTRTFLARAEDWQAVGRVHGERFGAIRPASTMVVVAGFLDPAWLVEMEFDAVIEKADHTSTGEPAMDANALRASAAVGEPPAGLSGPLTAMWHVAKGEWDHAHRIVQDDAGAAAAWVHAHLHRIEGDEGNAGYWYRQAGKPHATDELDEEWQAIVTALMTEGGV
jgi:enamine deaminase RidA (YjgF/YER057c/UK114 family)